MQCPVCTQERTEFAGQRSPTRTPRCIPCDQADSTKWCSDCKQWKSRSEFYKNRSQPDGLQPVCTPCQKVRLADWALR